jgi:acetyl-CoA C-acetyltransferase
VPLAGSKGRQCRPRPRRGHSRRRQPEGLASLKTIAPDGRITAGNASQICDGASGVLVVSEAALKLHGLTPLARIDNLTVTAGDPVIMLDEPIPPRAARSARSGGTSDEIDLYEVNEAFAPVPLAWLRKSGADPARSTSTAARSRSAIRSARAGPS